MQFQFDANQEYQLKAITAVTDLFDGLSGPQAGAEFKLSATFAAVSNRLDIEEPSLLSNLQNVQSLNGITPDRALQCIVETMPTAAGPATVRFWNFSVEMETGTGKTYVYLRTALELNRQCGMRKFIVVVPSVAIREGVLKTLKVTASHFRSLYENPVYRFYVYDSANLSQVRQFAMSDAVEVMVMTIDSFNKAANVLRQSTDRLQGETPLYLVQETRPILILDEPQNMESEKSIAALSLLNPLMALRYSATHRNPYNVVYRLTPAEAYRQNLVKKIEVDSVMQRDDENQPFLCVEDIQTNGNRITARLRVHKLMKSGTVKEITITVKRGDSLVEKARRPEYEGFEIEEIHPGENWVRFANQREMRRGEELGADREALFAAQIRHTIEAHFRKQARLREKGVKVLSLFFIDRVSNYAGEDGIIRRLFDEAFDDLKCRHADWAALDAAAVQAAYFAEKHRRGGKVELVDSVGGETSADALAYDLIMRDKENLLSFPTPDDDEDTRRKRQVCFIFSHSALREGWDNPNVFQICTLNQTASLVKKRQEIGRGIRLAVNQKGQRVQDAEVNVLRVVANESYRRYVETLQSEIADEYRAEIEARMGKAIADLSAEERLSLLEEYGKGILPPPPRQAGRGKARLRKRRELNARFRDLWQRINYHTRYAVEIDTDRLLADALPEIERQTIAHPRIEIVSALVRVDDDDAFDAVQVSGAMTAIDLAGRCPLPNLLDVMSLLLQSTSPPVRLTRRTLLRLFRSLANRQAATENPREFAGVVVRCLKEKLADHLVNGIRYEKTGTWYEMERILDAEEIDLFGKIVEAESDSALYDHVGCDSAVEEQFVKDMEARRDVRLYFKLPPWFEVRTPVGNYRPDWAVVLEEAEEAGRPLLYFVAETKGEDWQKELRPHERRKIECAAAHFGSSQWKKAGVMEDHAEYKVVTRAAELS